MAPLRVLITRRVPPPAVELLQSAGCSVESFEQEEPPTRAEILRQVAGVHAMIAMLSERIDAELLDAAGPGLRVVANFAVGIDNVDLAACAARGVRVTNTPGVLTDATADLTWALLLGAARRVVAGDRFVRSGRWSGWSPTQYLGLSLQGATLGLIGAGRIGTAVARRGFAFGLRIRYVHPRPNAELDAAGALRCTLAELLPVADVLSLHIPMRPENRHLLGAAEFRQMKRTAILVNTARGAVVDEVALVTALQTGQIAAAGLDVYEQEPRLTAGLAGLENVVLLPHLGSATTATRERMSRMVAENVLAVLSGGAPPNEVGRGTMQD